METSIAMARLAVADGTTHLACTPHIYPGVYANSTATIAPALQTLQAELDALDIPLTLVMGADVHMVPEVMEGLKKGRIPTLHGSRYFLLEPSHHVPVPHFLAQIENFLNAGYVPILTHPERLRWLDEHYDDFIQAARIGAWLQITAGAITGNFGPSAKKRTERLLSDGVVHIIASDAHSIDHRPPIMSGGVTEAIRLLRDEAEVIRMVKERPQAILDNAEPDLLPAPLGLGYSLPILLAGKFTKKSWFNRLFN
ncbi:MAG: capsular biosynthesis protein [Candidatus Thiothrix putei]|uniref:protein-tyrosine-phosphatase n=1 Tax=Candidatus Thiothrix putei TaxID=3080811 RepID=A0AA95HJD3_9GAMM|nr:MAG: capsular biosynthesis protein [Candidatus Thiothrix putei]